MYLRIKMPLGRGGGGGSRGAGAWPFSSTSKSRCRGYKKMSASFRRITRYCRIVSHISINYYIHDTKRIYVRLIWLLEICIFDVGYTGRSTGTRICILFCSIKRKLEIMTMKRRSPLPFFTRAFLGVLPKFCLRWAPTRDSLWITPKI